MSKVLGKNAIVYFWDGGMWKIAVCARSCEFNTSTEFMETSILGSGKTRTFIPTMNASTGGLEGIVTLNEANVLTLPELRALQLTHTRLVIRFQRIDEAPVPNVYADEVGAYIANTKDIGSYSDVAGFSVDLQGDGPITQIFTPTPQTAGIVTRKDFTPTAGQTELTDATLIGKTLLELIIEESYGPLITAGTPVNKEFKFTSSTGKIEWGIAASGDEVTSYYTFQ